VEISYGLYNDSMIEVIEVLTECSQDLLIPMKFYSLDEDFKSSSYLTETLLDLGLDMRMT
jgi:hypothetical protein